MKRIFLILILLLLTALAAVLASLNAAPVVFDYYLTTTELPLALVLFAAFAMGSLFGLILSISMVIAGLAERRRLRKQLSLCQQEIRNLRDIPIKGPY